MTVDPPFNVYRDQLTSQHQGLALWNPHPPNNHVSIGDVGYVRAGLFIRMFNVILPWDHESNRTLGKPEPYKSLDSASFTQIFDVTEKTQEHYSRHVSAKRNDSNAQVKEPDGAEGATYICRGQGALLLLPHGGLRTDIIRTKAFEEYIRDHVVSWFTWAQKNQQGISRMEDLILVSGCTLVSSWAAAAFVDNTVVTKISLARRSRSDGGESFIWGDIRGAVEYHDGNINTCVFIRGFRAKRVPFRTKPMRAVAEPRPDDPDNGRDDEIQVSRVPDGPKYRDPLVGILDYIVEKCSNEAKAEDIVAIVHDDDLRLIKDVEILTADAIEEFLREKQIPLLIENGVAILRDSPETRQVAVEGHEFGNRGRSRQENTAFISLPGDRPLIKFADLLKLESSPTMTADDFSWPEAGSTTRSVETQGQDETVQEASRQDQQPSTGKQRGKKKAKNRMRIRRAEDNQYFTKVCDLFNIPTAPMKTRPERILVSAEDLMHRLEETEATVATLREDLARPSAEGTTGSALLRSAEWKPVHCSEDFQPLTKLCELFDILPAPRRTLHHRILVCVEDLVHRFEETEATVVALKEDLARASAKRTIGSALPETTRMELGT